MRKKKKTISFVNAAIRRKINEIAARNGVRSHVGYLIEAFQKHNKTTEDETAGLAMSLNVLVWAGFWTQEACDLFLERLGVTNDRRNQK